jgi:hypothetical protein
MRELVHRHLARRDHKQALERKQARAIIVDKQYFWNLHVGTRPVLDGWAIQIVTQTRRKDTLAKLYVKPCRRRTQISARFW